MRFLCDVHIPISLSKYLESIGHDCIHVNFILNKWHTKDKDIIKFVDTENRILITKDEDFKNSHLLIHQPQKLIKINLGNISNIELIKNFEMNLDVIINLESIKVFLLEVDKQNIYLFTPQSHI